MHSSGLFKLCEKGERLNGSELKVSDGSEIGEHLIGDSGYPLLPCLLTPYHEKDLTESETEFHRRRSSARTVAPKTQAKFQDTWKFLQGEMWRPDKHKLPRIIHRPLQETAMNEPWVTSGDHEAGMPVSG